VPRGISTSFFFLLGYGIYYSSYCFKRLNDTESADKMLDELKMLDVRIKSFGVAMSKFNALMDQLHATRMHLFEKEGLIEEKAMQKLERERKAEEEAMRLAAHKEKASLMGDGSEEGEISDDGMDIPSPPMKSDRDADAALWLSELDGVIPGNVADGESNSEGVELLRQKYKTNLNGNNNNSNNIININNNNNNITNNNDNNNKNNNDNNNSNSNNSNSNRFSPDSAKNISAKSKEKKVRENGKGKKSNKSDNDAKEIAKVCDEPLVKNRSSQKELILIEQVAKKKLSEKDKKKVDKKEKKSRKLEKEREKSKEKEKEESKKPEISNKRKREASESDEAVVVKEEITSDIEAKQPSSKVKEMEKRKQQETKGKENVLTVRRSEREKNRRKVDSKFGSKRGLAVPQNAVIFDLTDDEPDNEILVKEETAMDEVENNNNNVSDFIQTVSIPLPDIDESIFSEKLPLADQDAGLTCRTHLFEYKISLARSLMCCCVEREEIQAEVGEIMERTRMPNRVQSTLNSDEWLTTLKGGASGQ
jgi:hypothetical protein